MVLLRLLPISRCCGCLRVAVRQHTHAVNRPALRPLRTCASLLSKPISSFRCALRMGHWTLRGYGYWAVEEKDGSAFIGACGLWFPEGWPELELGYWLMPEAHRKGYASEAADRARRHAFEELESPSLVSYIDAQNTASIRVAERLGAYHDSTIQLGRHGPHCVYRYPR